VKLKKFFESYSLSIMFIIASATVFFVSLHSGALASFFVETSEKNIAQRMSETSKRLAMLVSAEELSMYNNAEDMELPSYKALRLKLFNFSKETEVLYAYCMRVKNGMVQYILDNDFNDSTRVGLDTPPIAADSLPGILPILNGKDGVTELGMYASGWEGLISAYSPILDDKDDAITICGVDINDEEIMNARKKVVILRIMELISVVIVFFCGAFGFIRFRREADAAKNANAAKSQFLSRMSHEIRTPMNAIIGLADIALHRDISSTAREEIITIKRAGSNLLSIINDILDFSKIESGKLEIIPRNYLFSSLINDVTSIIKMKLADSSVRFDVNIDSDIPDMLFGDDARIRQILLNVLSNAVKYTKNGFISFSVNGKVIKEPNECKVLITMEVADSGIGIKQEDLGKLFNDFVRINVKRNKDVEGTGLGLAIAKNLAKAMAGNISVSSEYGKGSIFTITLPQKIRYIEPLSLIENPEANMNFTVRFSAPTAKVLVVDDIATNLKIADGLLMLYNINADLCLSGTEAIDQIIGATRRGSPYNLVFMDHMMPEMDGVEATKHIREMSFDFPIVALTANAVAGVKEMFLKNGFNDFLSKPIDMAKLDAILEKWIPKEMQEKGKFAFNGKHDLSEIKLQTLATFYKDGTQKIEEIKKCLETKNYQLYTIYVHALKSASANIGANEISMAARELEIAGEQRDAEYIKLHTEQFLVNLKHLLNNIKIRLEEIRDNESLNVNVLIKLKEALKALNPDAINGAVNELQKFAQADNILQSVLIGHYEEAITEIEKYEHR